MTLNRKRILLVGNHFQDSNHNINAWQELASQLASVNYDVITTSHKLHRISRLLDMIFTIISRRKAYDMAQVDIFSGPAFFWGFICVILLKIIQKPTVITLRGGNLPDFNRQHPGLVKYLLNKPNIVTVPSNYLLNALKPYRNDLRLLPNAINIHKYPFKNRGNAEPKLIWLRAFHKIYNPELAIEVIAQLKTKFPNIGLSMIGPDKGDGSMQRTRQLAVQLNVEELVDFPGKVTKEEVSKWLNQGDIFINTTNYDNTPISVMEAMACGLCVVSTNVGGVPYLIDDQVNGLLVPPDSPDELADAVERILSDPKLAHRLSTNAREKVQNYDWPKILPLWENLIISLI